LVPTGTNGAATAARRTLRLSLGLRLCASTNSGNKSMDMRTTKETNRLEKPDFIL
jgi:hypothetical protein